MADLTNSWVDPMLESIGSRTSPQKQSGHDHLKSWDNSSNIDINQSYLGYDGDSLAVKSITSDMTLGTIKPESTHRRETSHHNNNRHDNSHNSNPELSITDSFNIVSSYGEHDRQSSSSSSSGQATLSPTHGDTISLTSHTLDGPSSSSNEIDNTRTNNTILHPSHSEKHPRSSYPSIDTMATTTSSILGYNSNRQSDIASLPSQQSIQIRDHNNDTSDRKKKSNNNDKNNKNSDGEEDNSDNDDDDDGGGDQYTIHQDQQRPSQLSSSMTSLQPLPPPRITAAVSNKRATRYSFATPGRLADQRARQKRLQSAQNAGVQSSSYTVGVDNPSSEISMNDNDHGSSLSSSSSIGQSTLSGHSSAQTSSSSYAYATSSQSKRWVFTKQHKSPKKLQTNLVLPRHATTTQIAPSSLLDAQSSSGDTIDTYANPPSPTIMSTSRDVDDDNNNNTYSRGEDGHRQPMLRLSTFMDGPGYNIPASPTSSSSSLSVHGSSMMRRKSHGEHLTGNHHNNGTMSRSAFPSRSSLGGQMLPPFSSSFSRPPVALATVYTQPQHVHRSYDDTSRDTHTQQSSSLSSSSSLSPPSPNNNNNSNNNNDDSISIAPSSLMSTYTPSTTGTTGTRQIKRFVFMTKNDFTRRVSMSKNVAKQVSKSALSPILSSDGGVDGTTTHNNSIITTPHQPLLSSSHIRDNTNNNNNDIMNTSIAPSVAPSVAPTITKSVRYKFVHQIGPKLACSYPSSNVQPIRPTTPRKLTALNTNITTTPDTNTACQSFSLVPSIDQPSSLSTTPSKASSILHRDTDATVPPITPLRLSRLPQVATTTTATTTTTPAPVPFTPSTPLSVSRRKSLVQQQRSPFAPTVITVSNSTTPHSTPSSSSVLDTSTVWATPTRLSSMFIPHSQRYPHNTAATTNTDATYGTDNDNDEYDIYSQRGNTHNNNDTQHSSDSDIHNTTIDDTIENDPSMDATTTATTTTATAITTSTTTTSQDEQHHIIIEPVLEIDGIEYIEDENEAFLDLSSFLALEQFHDIYDDDHHHDIYDDDDHHHIDSDINTTITDDTNNNIFQTPAHAPKEELSPVKEASSSPVVQSPLSFVLHDNDNNNDNNDNNSDNNNNNDMDQSPIIASLPHITFDDDQEQHNNNDHTRPIDDNNSHYVDDDIIMIEECYEFTGLTPSPSQLDHVIDNTNNINIINNNNMNNNSDNINNNVSICHGYINDDGISLLPPLDSMYIVLAEEIDCIDDNNNMNENSSDEKNIINDNSEDDHSINEIDNTDNHIVDSQIEVMVDHPDVDSDPTQVDQHIIDIQHEKDLSYSYIDITSSMTMDSSTHTTISNMDHHHGDNTTEKDNDDAILDHNTTNIDDNTTNTDNNSTNNIDLYDDIDASLLYHTNNNNDSDGDDDYDDNNNDTTNNTSIKQSSDVFFTPYKHPKHRISVAAAALVAALALSDDDDEDDNEGEDNYSEEQQNDNMNESINNISRMNNTSSSMNNTTINSTLVLYDQVLGLIPPIDHGDDTTTTTTTTTSDLSTEVNNDTSMVVSHQHDTDDHTIDNMHNNTSYNLDSSNNTNNDDDDDNDDDIDIMNMSMNTAQRVTALNNELDNIARVLTATSPIVMGTSSSLSLSSSHGGENNHTISTILDQTTDNIDIDDDNNSNNNNTTAMLNTTINTDNNNDSTNISAFQAELEFVKQTQETIKRRKSRLSMGNTTIVSSSSSLPYDESRQPPSSLVHQYEQLVNISTPISSNVSSSTLASVPQSLQSSSSSSSQISNIQSSDNKTSLLLPQGDIDTEMAFIQAQLSLFIHPHKQRQDKQQECDDDNSINNDDSICTNNDVDHNNNNTNNNNTVTTTTPLTPLTSPIKQNNQSNINLFAASSPTVSDPYQSTLDNIQKQAQLFAHYLNQDHDSDDNDDDDDDDDDNNNNSNMDETDGTDSEAGIEMKRDTITSTAQSDDTQTTPTKPCKASSSSPSSSAFLPPSSHLSPLVMPLHTVIVNHVIVDPSPPLFSMTPSSVPLSLSPPHAIAPSASPLIAQEESGHNIIEASTETSHVPSQNPNQQNGDHDDNNNNNETGEGDDNNTNNNSDDGSNDDTSTLYHPQFNILIESYDDDGDDGETGNSNTLLDQQTLDNVRDTSTTPPHQHQSSPVIHPSQPPHIEQSQDDHVDGTSSPIHDLSLPDSNGFVHMSTITTGDDKISYINSRSSSPILVPLPSSSQRHPHVTTITTPPRKLASPTITTPSTTTTTTATTSLYNDNDSIDDNTIAQALPYAINTVQQQQQHPQTSSPLSSPHVQPIPLPISSILSSSAISDDLIIIPHDEVHAAMMAGIPHAGTAAASSSDANNSSDNDDHDDTQSLAHYNDNNNDDLTSLVDSFNMSLGGGITLTHTASNIPTRTMDTIASSSASGPFLPLLSATTSSHHPINGGGGESNNNNDIKSTAGSIQFSRRKRGGSHGRRLHTQSDDDVDNNNNNDDDDEIVSDYDEHVGRFPGRHSSTSINSSISGSSSSLRSRDRSTSSTTTIMGNNGRHTSTTPMTQDQIQHAIESSSLDISADDITKHQYIINQHDQPSVSSTAAKHTKLVSPEPPTIASIDSSSPLSPENENSTLFGAFTVAVVTLAASAAAVGFYYWSALGGNHDGTSSSSSSDRHQRKRHGPEQ